MKSTLSGKLQFLLIAICASILSGCTEKNSIEYIPFQSEEDGEWGLMSSDGQVLCKERFQFSPTVATCGRFWVQNKKGFYELYKAEENPVQIGDTEYRYVSLFFNDKAFATPVNSPIIVIDKEGKELIKLGKIEGKVISSLHDISEGHAVAVTDTVEGLVNTEGEVIIKPKYFQVFGMHDGYAIAYDRNYTMCQSIADSIPTKKEGQIPKGYATVFDKKGQEVMKIQSGKYIQTGGQVFDKYLPVAKRAEGICQWGIIDLEGQEIVKPNKKYREISQISKECFIYKDEQGQYGLAKFDGSKIISPQFIYLAFASPKTLVAIKKVDNSDDDPSIVYYDIEGNKIFNKAYVEGSDENDGYTFVSPRKGRWMVLDSKGEEVKDVPDIYDIDIYHGSQTLRSDYIDMAQFIKALGITDNGIDGLTFSSSVQTALKTQAKYYSFENKPKAADYTGTQDVYIYRTIEGIGVEETVHFPTTLSKRTYRTEQVIDYVDYWTGYYWYHNTQVPTGYAFSNSHPAWFSVSFNNYYIFYGKMQNLLKALLKHLDTIGTLKVSNSSAAVYALSNGKEAVVWLDEHDVKLMWGDLSSSDKEIFRYDGNKEKFQTPIEIRARDYNEIDD